MKELERTLKALANRRRLAILAFLKMNHEATVGEIAAHIRLSIKAASKHLAILKSTEIVSTEQRSLYVYYFLSIEQKLPARMILTLL